MSKIYCEEDLISVVNEYGIINFWDENRLSTWTLSGVNFNTLWSIRENAVNSKKVVYGKFLCKKATFVSLELFPALCALRRDGYDFDSLSDEGLVPHREALVMGAVNAAHEPVPSYALGKSLSMKGYDAVVTSLQNKTYLCLSFKKSMMGTALLSAPEDMFGYDYVRSAYNDSAERNIQKLKSAKGLQIFTDSELTKILNKAI